MKTCSTCPKLIKNGYTLCYECNNKLDSESDTTSETDERAKPEVIVKRESIPKCVRNAVWRHQNNNQIEAKCICCRVETVTIGNFHVGHITSIANGGTTTLDNLTVLCMLCNTSMGKCNVYEFIDKYKLHYFEKNPETL